MPRSGEGTHLIRGGGGLTDPLTTENAETRFAGHGRMMGKDGLRAIRQRLARRSSAVHRGRESCGRVAAELREADSFAGLFPCRPDGRFGAFRGQAQAHEVKHGTRPPCVERSWTDAKSPDVRKM